MLILTRRVDESLVIGDNVTVTILGVKGNQVRIGVDAPRDVTVHREELAQKQGLARAQTIPESRRLRCFFECLRSNKRIRKTMASNITVSPLTPAIGAEIGNIDLRQVSSDEIAEIRAALLEYKVVFFRDQTLTQVEHISFAREFGDLEIHPATPKSQSNPEVLHIAHGPESKGKKTFGTPM